MVYYNPHINGYYNPLFKATNRGFEHCSPEKIAFQTKQNRFPTITCQPLGKTLLKVKLLVGYM